MNYRFLTLLFVLSLLLVGCGDSAGDPTPLPAPAPGEITVLDLRAPEAPTGITNGAVYFTLQNGFDRPLHLLAAETIIASRVSFHETVNTDGIVRMLPQPDGFTVAPGESLILAPGGGHLMLENLQNPLQPGDEFALLLTFADAGPLTLTVPVVAWSEER
jgi:copper(I)-binding protein